MCNECKHTLNYSIYCLKFLPSIASIQELVSPTFTQSLVSHFLFWCSIIHGKFYIDWIASETKHKEWVPVPLQFWSTPSELSFSRQAIFWWPPSDWPPPDWPPANWLPPGQPPPDWLSWNWQSPNQPLLDRAPIEWQPPGSQHTDWPSRNQPYQDQPPPDHARPDWTPPDWAPPDWKPLDGPPPDGEPTDWPGFDWPPSD